MNRDSRDRFHELVKRTLATAPPLTPERRDRIARLLTPAEVSNA